jgi:chaperonin GroES
MMKRIMVGDKVLIKRKKLSEGTKLIMAEDMNPYTGEGIVVEVGPGIRDQNGNLYPMTVKVGDLIVVPAGGGIGRPIEIDKEEFIVCRESEIPVILREE